MARLSVAVDADPTLQNIDVSCVLLKSLNTFAENDLAVEDMYSYVEWHSGS